MNYFKLETVKEILRTRYDATCVSVGEPRGEAWERRIGGQTHRALLGWDHEEHILTEFDVRYVARALRIEAAELVERIRAAGGLWLGPSPR